MPEKQPSKQQKIERHIEKHVEKRLSEELVSRGELLGHLFKQHVSTAVIAAFSFLIALSWKDLVVHLVSYFIKDEILKNSPYLSELISAIVVTIIAILGIMLITTWAKKPHVLVSETKVA